MSNVRFVAALATALAIAAPALAQSPSGAAPAPPSGAAQAAPTGAAQAAAAAAEAKCGKVDDYPGRTATPSMIRGWNKDTATWQDCMKKHIAEMQAKTETAIKAANQLVAESNAAIALFNETVKRFQAQVDATK